ncbi:alpha/beta hydrolase [Lacihabitans sp. LS3-19]|uniref:patatin-like phospholipase family protein n=1 Tax=Lacihabitans sp. LS3-19 TaxID=2487335 RepID=UPI0020CF72AB|nr:patatin-like phospholipase family protein [Lacihabitans sp. LS3-19]MCP9770862.1 alpha/beta hydrolase [Lacihabitans sp. LS3-19]
MNAKDFTENTEVKDLIKKITDKKPLVSDTLDAKGNQYVDIVMEGGGVLGIALVGYTYALEKAKIKFCSLAGTSAGAINSMMLASMQPKTHDTISEELIDIIASKDFFDFVDGDSFVRKLIKDVLGDKPLIWVGIKHIFHLGKLFRLIRDELGLNDGNNFEEWIQDILHNKANVKTTKDLQNHRDALAKGLILRENIEGNKVFSSKIAIITSDITTQTKVEFPLHNNLYFSNPEETSPSKYVRATMSIPLFFKPMTVENIPKNQEKVWDDAVGYTGEIPDKVRFVDGGTLSNFPINVFHLSAGVPRKPTFGVRLGKDRQKFNSFKTFLKFFYAIFNTMRYLHEYDFLLKNKDYKNLIGRIDTDGHNWLNFDISDEEKLDLFIRGVKAAQEFLDTFDWIAYKKLRATLN